MLLPALRERLRAPRPVRRTTATHPDRSPWRALRHRSMRLWSGANLVSSAGTWMQMTVQNLLVLQVTGSPAAAGLSLAVQAGPGLLLGVAGGALVDRWPHKVVVAASQAVLGVIAFATAVLAGLEVLNLPILLALAALTGIVATVDGPASALLGNDLVPVDDVPSAIGLGSMVHNAGRLLGVALAGGAIALAGPACAYAANGVSFVLVAGVVPFLRLHPQASPHVVPAHDAAADAAPGTVRDTARDTARDTVADTPATAGAQSERGAAAPPAGLGSVRFFRSRPRLVALTVITAVGAVFGRNYTLTLTVLVTGALAGTAQDFATVSTVLAVGGILGAFLAGRLRRPTVRLVALLAAVGAALQLLAGIAPSLALLLVVVGPMAAVESLSDTAGTTVLQTDPPAAMRGRVLGVWRSASTAWGLAGPPLLGLLMELAGARGALVVGSLVVLVTIGAGTLRYRGSLGFPGWTVRRHAVGHRRDRLALALSRRDRRRPSPRRGSRTVSVAPTAPGAARRRRRTAGRAPASADAAA